MSEVQVKWYIEKEFFWEGQPDTILSALKNLNVEFYLQKYKPFEKGYSYDVFQPNDCVLVHGSIEFVNRVYKEAPWVPGATWIDKKNLLCSTYYSFYGEHLLNQEYCFVTLSELKRRKDFYFKVFGENNKMFIRPDSPYKEFTGFVAEKDTLETKILTMSYVDLDPTLLVLIAKPKKILAEYRFYICRGEVVTGCRYMLNAEHDEKIGYSGNALLLAQELSKMEWMPSPIFVVDIGETEDGECKLLEINSFNSSGMYLCDLEKIVVKANEKALIDWKGTYEDL